MSHNEPSNDRTMSPAMICSAKRVESGFYLDPAIICGLDVVLCCDHLHLRGMATTLLSEADIQEWLDEKSPADLVSALYQMLEPPARADELCTPVVPITTPPDKFTERKQRPQIHAWPKTAIGAAEVGALLVGTTPTRADALPLVRKTPPHEWKGHTVVQSEQQQEQQHLVSVQNEKQLARIAARREFVLRKLATRQPSGNKLSQKRSERASKRPRGPRGRYLPHDEIADVV